MELLTPVDEALLDALATYGLLTVAQGVRLGLANDKHVRERLNRFKKLGLARRLKTAKRMFPYVYWLTPKGAGVLQELAAESGQPCKVTARDVDYRPSEHLLQRIGIVDCHIALGLWAEDVGAVVDEVRQKFHPHTKLGKALRLEAVGRVYEPDALAMFRTPDGAAWLVAFEVETGGGSERLDNFTKHLAARLDVLEAATMERALKRQAGQKPGACCLCSPPKPCRRGRRSLRSDRTGGLAARPLQRPPAPAALLCRGVVAERGAPALFGDALSQNSRNLQKPIRRILKRLS